jgi:5-methylcytosine-specific restriction endonuclease McrA
MIHERYRLNHLLDEALHANAKALAGRHNALTAELLAHLAEVEARGIHRERACSSLYTYCVYELRFSEDEAQRRAQAARAARKFPLLFEMLADGAIHMTGLLLLAPHLTADNQADLLARARFRTKREIERLVAEFAPRPDVPAKVEPLGPLLQRSLPATNLWQAYSASLAGPVRELPPSTARGEAPPAVFEEIDVHRESPALARQAQPFERHDSKPAVPLRYRIEFSVSQEYVDCLEEARNLLQHRIPNRDIAQVHELAMATFVEQLKKRRQAVLERPELPAAPGSSEPLARTESSAPLGSAPDGVKESLSSERNTPERAAEAPSSAPERMLECAAARDAERKRHVPAAVRRAVWSRDKGRCTFTDSDGRRCHERSGLEMHHELAFALGGPTNPENLRLVCRAHNTLLAERDFGKAHMECWSRRRLG